MDASQFDRLAMMVSGAVSRRGALAAVLAVQLFRSQAGSTLAWTRKGKGKGKGKGTKKRGKKGKRKNRNGNDQTRNAAPPSPPAAVNAACYSGVNCTPGQGAINQNCNFAKSTLFRNLNARGSVLINANFREADLSKADLRGSALNGACFVDAVLLDAIIDSSTALGDAIFCNTRMPGGLIDNSGCDRATDCCPVTCENEICGSAPPCSVCPSGCPYDSLAAAVAGAASGDTILLCAGVYHTVGVTIAKNLIIAGAGSDPASTTLDAAGGGQVLTIAHGADVTILNLTVSGGSFNQGGGIGNAGTLRLGNVTVTGNEATGSGSGGGIFNTGTLRLQAGSNVKGNAATNGGGIATSGVLTLQSGSTVTGNTADLNGGGIANSAGGKVDLQRGSIVNANAATLNGGGIANSGALTMESGSTVLANMAANGAGIANLAGTATLQGASLVSGNTAQQEGGGIFLIGGTVNLANENVVINNTGSGGLNNCRPVGAVNSCIG